jgi:hypothetical protein
MIALKAEKKQFSHCLREERNDKRINVEKGRSEDVSYQKKITFHCYYVIAHLFTHSLSFKMLAWLLNSNREINGSIKFTVEECARVYEM